MSIKTVIIFIAVTVGVLGGMVMLLWNFGNNQDKPIPEVAGEMKHTKGEGEITIVEFSDFQCPACRAVGEPLAQIMEKYQGKVKLVYRHFPLVNIHKNAFIAAEAAEVAGLQGKFWEMHDKLFMEQASWESVDNPREMFVQYAKELEIDTEQFTRDLDSPEVKQMVNLDLSAATKYQLLGTPSFFVNGEKIEFNNLDARLGELTK